jgi:hypothetical protein
MKAGNQMAHSYEKHWHGERQTDPEFAGQGPDLGVFRTVLDADGLRFKPHAADRAVAGMVPLDFGMHRTGIDRLWEGERHWLERHAALWTIARLVADNFRMHRTRVFAGKHYCCAAMVFMLMDVLAVVVAMVALGMSGMVLLHRLSSRSWANRMGGA